MNQSTTNVDSVIKNSSINSNYFSSIAERAYSDVAAGMGLAVSTSEDGLETNVNVPISASINILKGDTHALMINNNFHSAARLLSPI
ncbi:MAG: hypothetical protein IKT98_06300 [Selenomonadaceae bacterium]|nr:hypothetical protein [Selenomonadaceae bacterium]